MAQPSTEVGRFRARATEAIEELRQIDTVLAIIEDHGADDAARQSFFDQEFGADSNNPDLTWAEFATAIVAMRAIRTAWQTNRLALAKLLR